MHWITQILLYIMIATMIDLMMPTSKMKQYVTFVLRLFLLYIYLQPIMLLFSIELHDITHLIDRTIHQEEIQYEQMHEEMMMQTNVMKQEQMARIISKLEEELFVSGNEALHTPNKYLINQVQLITDEQTVDADNIRQVIVHIVEEEREDIKAIEKIDVSKTNETSSEPSSADNEKISQLLSEAWSIPAHMIEIIWE